MKIIATVPAQDHKVHLVSASPAQLAASVDAQARRLFDTVACQAADDDSWRFFLDGRWYTPIALAGRTDICKALHDVCGPQTLAIAVLLAHLDDELVIDHVARCDGYDSAHEILERLR